MNIRGWVVCAFALVASTAGAKATIFDFTFNSSLASGWGSYDTAYSGVYSDHRAYNAVGSIVIGGVTYDFTGFGTMQIYDSPSISGYRLTAGVVAPGGPSLFRFTVQETSSAYDGAVSVATLFEPAKMLVESTNTFSFTSTPRVEGAPLPAAAGLPALAALGGVFVALRRRQARAA